MSDPNDIARSLRDRLGAGTEDRLGRAMSELLESPLVTGAIGRAFDAREKATQAQEVALGALNIPSAADIERLTRRLRSVSHRLEAIEDGVDRLDRALTPTGVEARLIAIEGQLRELTQKVDAALAGRTRDAGKATAAGAKSARTRGKAARPSSASSPKAPAAGSRRAGAASGPAAATDGNSSSHEG
jgi:hypothetical protein